MKGLKCRKKLGIEVNPSAVECAKKNGVEVFMNAEDVVMVVLSSSSLTMR